MIQSFINYAGGKYRLLDQLLPLFPNNVSCFIDLFAGSGVVGLNAAQSISSIEKVIMYDINAPLINLMKWVQSQDFKKLETDINHVIELFGLSNTLKNGYDYYNVNSTNGLATINKKSYLSLRDAYNASPSSLYLYVLVIYGFNNQLRFNKKGLFNNPVGKRDFNSKIIKKLSDFSTASKSHDVEFQTADFRNVPVEANNFYYVDPPYLISTATYNENGGWTKKDEKDLLNYLDQLDKVGGRFALSNVLSLKEKENKILINWISHRHYTVHHLNMDYDNSNYQTYKKGKTDEVLITNY